MGIGLTLGVVAAPNSSIEGKISTALILMKTALCFLSLLMFSWNCSAAYVTNYFLKVQGIRGETTITSFKDWIAVTSFNLGVSSSVTLSSGRASRNKSQFSPLVITKPLDRSSPGLFQLAANGSSPGDAELVAAIFDSAKPQTMLRNLCRIRLSKIAVVSLQSAAAINGSIIETWGVFYEKIDWDYYATTGDGRPDGLVNARWNVVAGTDKLNATDGSDGTNTPAGSIVQAAVALPTVSPVSPLKVTQEGPNQVRVEWSARKGINYVIATTEEVAGQFQPVQKATAQEDGMMSVVVETKVGAQFFIVQEETAQ
jgi:type VI secretion system Hcp family effector